MAWHAQLKFVMTECSKTQIRLTGLTCNRDHTFRRSRMSCSEYNGGILPEFELVRDFSSALVAFRFDEDLIKNVGAIVFTNVFRYRGEWGNWAP